MHSSAPLQFQNVSEISSNVLMVFLFSTLCALSLLSKKFAKLRFLILRQIRRFLEKMLMKMSREISCGVVNFRHVYLSNYEKDGG